MVVVFAALPGGWINTDKHGSFIILPS